MNFCTKCGSRLQAGIRFCTRCGAPVQAEPYPPAQDATSQPPTPAPQSVRAPEPSVAAPWQTTPAVAPQPAAADSKRCALPILLTVLGVLALVAVFVVGGLIYAGSRLKQKASAILHQTTTAAQQASTPNQTQVASPADTPPAGTPSDNPAALIGKLTSMLGGSDDDGDLVQSISDKDPVEPCTVASFPSPAAARIPLQQGTVITTAWGVKYEDVEIRNEIDSTTAASFKQIRTTGKFKEDDGHEANPSMYTDTICNSDLASANTFVTVTSAHMPHLIHGVTRLRLSSKSFEEAKSSGQFTFRYFDILTNGDDVKPTYEEGLLKRVEPQDVPFPMIVNDQLVNLPAIHLVGIIKSVGKDPTPRRDRPDHSEAEVYVIDDPSDPLVLLWKLKDAHFHDGKFRVEVVKIDFKVPHPVNTVEKQLAEQKRAITYGIYFDFNKDTIKPESEPVLKQIMQAMTDNPTWKLTVEGHTDNIGGDAYNLDLSKRRAAAVKQALVTRHHIAPDRLSADGFGASSPIDTNDTLEGRARNRRVELTRE